MVGLSVTDRHLLAPDVLSAVTERDSGLKGDLWLLRSRQSSGDCLLEAFPGGLGEGVGRVENQAGDVLCFVARPIRLGWGDPSATDGVVKFVVVGDTDSPAVSAEPGTRIGARRRVVVRHVPEVEFEIEKAPHVPASRHGAGQVDGDRGPGCVPPGSDPTALMWCEVQDGAAWFLGDSGETRGLAFSTPGSSRSSGDMSSRSARQGNPLRGLACRRKAL